MGRGQAGRVRGGTPSVRHIVWDWNGTLFDDHTAVLDATNDTFVLLGASALTQEQYLELYCQPIPLFYERALGRRLGAEEFRHIDDVFHRSYRAALASCGLAPGARELLSAWTRGGRTQSLLSMWNHDELVPLVTTYGLAGHFLRVDGRTEENTGLKAGNLARHLDHLGLDPSTVALIGDSLDDADAARSVGASCVLRRGSHDERALAGSGVPVVDTLADAMALLGG